MRRMLALLLTAAAGPLLTAGVSAQSDTITVPPDRAMLIVRVPAAAALTIGGKLTSQTGVERIFTTPPLQPGIRYSYEIVARWNQGGKETVAKRVINFAPGQARVVDFTAAVATKAPQPTPKATPAKTRSFLFTYAGRVTDLKPGTPARIWLPLAASNPQQDVTVTGMQLAGAKPQTTHDKEYGNTILYLEAKANDKGEIPFAVAYQVLRREVRTDVRGNLFLQPAPGEKLGRYLRPDARVPITGKPLEVLKDKLKGQPLPKDSFTAAKKLYDIVNHYMTYKKVGTGWGHGDVLWACDSRYGNCTDFHSLFIAMARGNQIAAKFEMGFELPPSKRGAGPIGGYHCWAWFLVPGKGWIPVDISDANQHPEEAEYDFGNLSDNRISFSRDIELEPRQKGPPLNFLIYPYVEVDGKAYPGEKVRRQFAYKDLP